MAVPFGEATVLRDGRRIVTPWGKRGFYLGSQFVDGPVLRMPDGAIDAANRVWVCGHDQVGPGAQVWCEGFGWLAIPQGGFFPRLILTTRGTTARIAMTTSATSWREITVAIDPASNTLQLVGQTDSGTVPGGEGGHGMRDWAGDLGKAQPLAPIDQFVSGYPVRSKVTANGVTIAIGRGNLGDQIVLERGGQLGTLSTDAPDWWTPRLSQDGQYWSAVSFGKHLALGGRIPAVLPPLVLAPAIAPFSSAAEVGAYFAVSARYPTDPDAPGSVVVIAEVGLRTSRPVILTARAETATGKVDLIPEWADRWEQVRAVQVTTEDGGLVTEAARARQAMSSRGLPLRPLISYTSRVVPDLASQAAVDVVGCECYPNQGETVAQAEAAWRRFLAGTSRPVALIVGQFDRRRTPTGPPVISAGLLAACQPRYEALCRELGHRVRHVLAFSWGRPGGLRDYPELRPWLAAMAEAYPTPPPPTLTPPAKVTIDTVTPTSGTRPFGARAVAVLSGGPAGRLLWRRRRKTGPTTWTEWMPIRNNPATDLDHTFVFVASDLSGTYDVGVDVTGPDNETITDGTKTPRLIQVL